MRTLAAGLVAVALANGVVWAAVPDRWEPWDAGPGYGAGVTDRVAVTVGRAVSIALPRAVVLTVCDDASLLETVGVGETISVSGRKAGRTQCGFWFEDNPVPHRLFEVTVRAAALDAGRADGG